MNMTDEDDCYSLATWIEPAGVDPHYEAKAKTRTQRGTWSQFVFRARVRAVHSPCTQLMYRAARKVSP